MKRTLVSIERLRSAVWWLVPSFLLAALGAQAAIGALAPRTTEMQAVWEFRPKTLLEARAKAELIVRAEVISVDPGDDLVATFPNPADGEDRQPTQRVTVRVSSVIKGSAKPGDELVLFQQGGFSPSVHAERYLNGDPKYIVGENYVLLLRRQQTPPGLLMTVAPEGRYRIGADGNISAMIENIVTKDVARKPAAELEARLKQP